jgi:hypothetical protein
LLARAVAGDIGVAVHVVEQLNFPANMVGLIGKFAFPPAAQQLPVVADPCGARADVVAGGVEDPLILTTAVAGR